MFQKTNISNPLIYVRVRITRWEMLVFWKTLRTYQMNDSILDALFLFTEILSH